MPRVTQAQIDEALGQRNAALRKVDRLKEEIAVLRAAVRFNEENTGLIERIREILNAHGHAGAPFLDEAVRALVRERDTLRGAEVPHGGW